MFQIFYASVTTSFTHAILSHEAFSLVCFVFLRDVQPQINARSRNCNVHQRCFDDIEFLLLYEASNKKNPALPYWKYDHFDITRLTDEECKADFRFGIAELPLLAQSLKIPESFVCKNGTVAGGMEGLCILLRRYAYPCRLSDLIPMFGRSVPELSEIVSEVSGHIFSTHGYLLRTLNQPWLQPDQLQRFADAVYSKGAALKNCWGFIDGTVRPISRPGEHQRVMYNGHKRVHAIKFQSVAGGTKWSNCQPLWPSR